MPKFAANLTMMFTEYPFIERFKYASEIGFKAVEYLFPYDFKSNELKEQLDKYNLNQVLFNLYPGDWQNGERGFAAIPGRENEFKESIEQAIEYAKTLNCKQVHAMAGITKNLDYDLCKKTYINNLFFAAEKLKPLGIKLLVEPINNRDMPDYFISKPIDTLKILEEINSDNISLQLDLYHAQIMNGDITKLIEKLKGRFAHIQIASVPNRHEPDEGELNYDYLFEVLDNQNYEGFIGLEYNPRGKTADGLKWFEKYRNTLK